MFKLFSKLKQAQPPIYCIRYKVKGINPKTGRRKTEHIIVGSWEQLTTALPRCGLLEPYEYERNDKLPTERQLEYTSSIGIRIPPFATLEDVSLLITRYNENDDTSNPPTASSSFFKYAVEHNVFLPYCANKNEALDWLINALPDNKKEINSLK